MKKILIVEDNDGIRMMVSILLQKAGYETYEVTDGKEAISFLSMNQEIDVMLLDVMMPNLDGIETLKKLKEYKKEHELKICMMTALNQLPDISSALSHGADDYVVKPIEKENFIEKIYQLINNSPKTKFFNCKVGEEARILMPNGYVSIELVTVNEFQFEFTSNAAIPLEAKAIFESILFKQVLEGQARVFAKIYGEYDYDGEKRYKASFIGFTEAQTKKMRAATITKVISNEEQDTSN